MGEGTGGSRREQDGLREAGEFGRGKESFGRAMGYSEGREGIKTVKSMFYNMFHAKKAFAACVYEKKAVTL